MLSLNQTEQLIQFTNSIQAMERKYSSTNFQALCGLNKNEANVLATAPFMVNIIAQLLEDQ